MTQRYLTPDQLGLAMFWWSHPKYRWNTLQIAEALGLGREGEAIVYRSIAQRRDEQFRMRAIARRMAS